MTLRTENKGERQNISDRCADLARFAGSKLVTRVAGEETYVDSLMSSQVGGYSEGAAAGRKGADMRLLFGVRTL
jgi:hypothetical protein